MHTHLAVINVAVHAFVGSIILDTLRLLQHSLSKGSIETGCVKDVSQAHAPQEFGTGAEIK